MKLRYIIEQGRIDSPPMDLLTRLGNHASLLSHLIRQYTIRHDYVDVNDKFLFSKYEDVITFATGAINQEPSYLSAPIVHEVRPDDELLYQKIGLSGQDYQDVLSWKQTWLQNDFEEVEGGEYRVYRHLGFSKQEYQDLVQWRKAYLQSEFDMGEAFDVFTNQVIKELMAGRYSVELKDLVQGISGLVQIGVDVMFFTNPAGVPSLLLSCIQGLTTIVDKFPEIRHKILDRGRYTKPLTD
jgi:hypothetical protein